MQRGTVRDRLTPGVFMGRDDDDAIARLERAFNLAHETAPLRRRLREAGVADENEAAAAGLISEDERTLLVEAEQAMLAAIAVDSFTPDELLEFAPVRRRAAAEASASGRAQRKREERCELPM
jgi:acyl-CoA dehydrogenase